MRSLTPLVLLLGLAVVGCGGGNDTKTPLAPMPIGGMAPAAKLEETGPHAAGRKVFNDNNCARCHQYGESAAGAPPAGPMMMNKGPNLTKVGATPGHTAESLAEYVRDPKAKKLDTKMPPFAAVKADDLKALGEFLAASK